MISDKTKKYLEKKEWGMGHGQCDECCGLKPGFGEGFANLVDPEECGHYKGCRFARLLSELGMEVVYNKVRV